MADPDDLSRHSVTRILPDLRSGDRSAFEQAAAEIWTRYSQQLLALIKGHLSQRVRSRTGEEDVLQSMYKSFCLRQQQGQFDLQDRDDLWTLLVTMALNKARSASRHHRRQKRDCRAEHVEARDPQGEDRSVLHDVPAAQPTPDQAVEMEELVQQRLGALPEPLRSLAMLKLAGYTNEQIAGPEMLNCSVRTIERKLAMIRRAWEEAADETPM